MAIYWRKTTGAELDECLRIQPTSLGDALIGREAAVAIWRKLIAHPAVITATLHADPPRLGHSIVGIGISAFLRRAFVDAELSNPRPDLNSRILARLHAGEPLLLTRDEVAAANAGPGLDGVILQGYTVPELRLDLEAQTISVSSLVESHAGYRLDRLVAEYSDPTCIEACKRTGFHDLVAEFPSHGRAFFVVSRERAQSTPGSQARVFFLHRPPRLGLRQADQELLLAALDGRTDEELADSLGLSQAAIKARWRSVFARVEAALPALVTEPQERPGTPNVRGGQKRHRVLAYVRENPVELRPWP